MRLTNWFVPPFTIGLTKAKRALVTDANNNLTFAIMPIIPTATVAAAGSTQTDAAAIATGFTLVSAANATKGVLLPAAAAGLVCIVKNIDAANAMLKIWPAGTNVINALSASAAFSIAAKTSVILVAYDATTWYSVPLLPS